jgi:hypothetical protein
MSLLPLLDPAHQYEIKTVAQGLLLRYDLT